MRLDLCLCSFFLLLPLSCSESDAASAEGKSDSASETATETGKAETPAPIAKDATEIKNEPAVKDDPVVIGYPVVDEELSIDIINAIMVSDSVLLGGQPSEAQFAEAADKGYQVIVTLRGDGEPGTDLEKGVIEELDMRFIQIPMASGGGFTEENARALAAVLEDPANHPVMVHCGSGNRVGGLFALKAFYVDGMEPEQALEIGRSHGMQNRLEGKVRASMK